MAIPIIVIARNRSGSKWLSNIIAMHQDVVCIQSPRAGGILETNMFSYFPRAFGDLGVIENYLGFALCYAESDFYMLTGLQRELLFRKEHLGKDCFELFRWNMDEVARRRGKAFWVQKGNIAQMPVLLEKFPEAKFLVIERDVVANVRSTVALSPHSGNRMSAIFRHVFGWVFAHKRARRFQNRNNVKIIQYEDLKNDRERMVHVICEHVGLTFEPQMLEDRYAPNTSFRNGLRRGDVLTPGQERWVRLVARLVELVPRSVLDALATWSHRREPRQRFVPGTYRTLRTEVGWTVPEASKGGSPPLSVSTN